MKSLLNSTYFGILVAILLGFLAFFDILTLQLTL